MTDQPPVSIFIITCLGSEARGRILKHVCENALALRYPEFEVVVSDNAGDFLAADALAGIHDPRLKIFRNEENVGFTGNMNLCVERCRYGIIKLHCDDDFLHPDFLNLTVPYVNDDTFVVTDYEKYNIGGKYEGPTEPIVEKPPISTRLAGYRNDIWKFPYISLPACTIFTKRLFEELGRYDIKSTATDWDFLMEAHYRKQVTYVQSTLCYMGVWEESVTQKSLNSCPFYFTYESLYTRFRFLRNDALSFSDHLYIRLMIFRTFFWESLRVPRHFTKKNYRKDYLTYLGRLKNYIGEGKKVYAHRANVSLDEGRRN